MSAPPPLLLDDWGARARRWAGVRSVLVEVQGRSVHLLRARAAAGAAAHAPTHVLLAPTGGSAASWLDVMPPLTALGPVIAVDLPGSGQTRPPSRRAVRPEAHAQFLRLLTGALDLDRVVVHGWSVGALTALRYAALDPGRVERLVLVAPPLPLPLRPAEVLGWQTLGRVARLAAPLLGRVLLRLVARRGAAVGATGTEPMAAAGDLHGGDVARISAEMCAVLAQEQAWRLTQPWRLDGIVVQWVAATSALYINRGAIRDLVDRVHAPALMVWGDDDRMVPRGGLDRALARRPDWRLHVIAAAGHLLPVEVPAAYAAVVARWSRGDAVPAGDVA